MFVPASLQVETELPKCSHDLVYIMIYDMTQVMSKLAVAATSHLKPTMVRALRACDCYLTQFE